MPPNNNTNQNPKTQALDRLRQANTVLVTVSANPSVDQLAGAIGTTLLLNKLGKHATTVFSGQVPSTIEFLRPEQTIEKTTDSLRDFIIALDKSKADKLRYKVEDKVVKIFITPYHTQITEKDLQFSQGDFNVEVILALGVNKKEDLDQAITAHGRILHDATVISVNTTGSGDLGNVNWAEPGASSLCEVLVSLSESLGENLLDGQMATAFLTGIVAETDRFSNEKAKPTTMAVAGKLMSAGASSQLVAKELEKTIAVDHQPDTKGKDKGLKAEPKSGPKQPADSGTLDINHDEPKMTELPPPAPDEDGLGEATRIDIDKEGTLRDADEAKKPAETSPKTDKTEPSSMITKPPTLGGRLTANTVPEPLDPTSDAMSQPSLGGPLLQHDLPASQPSSPQMRRVEPLNPDQKTLTEIEQSVDSQHLKPEPTPLAATPPAQTAENQQAGPAPEPPSGVDNARAAVEQAYSDGPPDLSQFKPLQSVGSQPIDLNLPLSPPPVSQEPDENQKFDLPPNLVSPPAKDETARPDSPWGSPPPGPPPIIPPDLPKAA